MRTGFMDLAANSIIPASPGQTALWIAREALAHDSNLSHAENPEKSLANTLSKQVLEGNEPRIKRERIRGIYCYFPVRAEREDFQDIAIQISVSEEELQILDNFVAVERFSNRSEVLMWLAREGIKARRSDIDEVASIRNKIEELKRSVPTI